MLPFLKKQEAALALPADVVKRNPDDESKEVDMLDGVAEELIAAVHAKDTKAVAMALKAAFEICEVYPHEEGPHLKEEG